MPCTIYIHWLDSSLHVNNSTGGSVSTVGPHLSSQWPPSKLVSAPKASSLSGSNFDWLHYIIKHVYHWLRQLTLCCYTHTGSRLGSGGFYMNYQLSTVKAIGNGLNPSHIFASRIRQHRFNFSKSLDLALPLDCLGSIFCREGKRLAINAFSY